MTGNQIVAKRAVEQLRAAFAAIHRTDHRGAFRALLPYDRGITDFPKLALARRRALAKAKKLAAREFLDGPSGIPKDFRFHNPSLYPDIETLTAVEGIEPPSEYDSDGEPLASYQGGLLFFGASGSGKTRAAFRLLEKWTLNENLRFRYFSAPVLKRRLADAARAGKAHQVIEEIVGDEDDSCGDVVIFIDDLSQARFTPAFAENLFELIDRIHRERRLLIVTVQTPGSALVRKWCADDKELADTAEAIARRLRDYCVKVRFTKTHQTEREAA